MLTLQVVNRQGEPVGTIEVDPAEFGGEVNKQLLHDVVVMYQANQRRGTHSTLRRGEVSGSTKKLFRQKGTGRARRGTVRTNKVKGGGTTKGPKPRDYEYHLPKKAVKAATRMAILSKLQDNEVVVVDDLSLAEIKTQEVAKILKALKLDEITCLLGYEGGADEAKKEANRKLFLSARNIPTVKILPAAEFNVYTILRQKRLVLTKAALEELRKAGEKKEAAAG
jgi:large subunit ribosomal protein L4